MIKFEQRGPFTNSKDRRNIDLAMKTPSMPSKRIPQLRARRQRLADSVRSISKASSSRLLSAAELTKLRRVLAGIEAIDVQLRERAKRVTRQ